MARPRVLHMEPPLPEKAVLSAFGCILKITVSVNIAMHTNVPQDSCIANQDVPVFLPAWKMTCLDLFTIVQMSPYSVVSAILSNGNPRKARLQLLVPT